MIRGYFNPASGWPAPWVRVFLYLPGIVEEWKPVEFLLDTGCSVTGLQPLDAIFRVGVPLDRIMDPNQWPSIQETRGVGGSLRNYPVPAYYALYDDAGRWEYVTGQILVAEFDAIAQSIPSLLGWDVLRHFDIHLRSSTDTVVLERSSPPQ